MVRCERKVGEVRDVQAQAAAEAHEPGKGEKKGREK